MRRPQVWFVRSFVRSFERKAELVSAAVLYASGCVPGEPAPEAVVCDTDYALTSGGDHGPPWENPLEQADDTTGEEEKLDTPQYADLGFVPPIAWESDSSSELLYRAPTEAEKRVNNWDETVLLVALETEFLRDVSDGASTATLKLPLTDKGTPWQFNLPVLGVDVALASSRHFVGVGGKRLSSNGAVQTVSHRPETRVYGQRGLDWDNIDDLAVMVSSTGDGVVIEGATHGRTFWLNGPHDTDNPSATYNDLAPPVGRTLYVLRTEFVPPLATMIASAQQVSNLAYSRLDHSIDDFAGVGAPQRGTDNTFNQCADDLNNDPDIDDVADGCDFMCMEHPDFGTDLFPGVEPVYEYARPFAIFGDARWCTDHMDTWQADLIEFGIHAEAMLNWVDVGPGPRVPPFRHVGIWCDVFPDESSAEDCHDNANCPPELAGYPLAGVANVWGEVDTSFSWPDSMPLTYLHRVWDFADRWATQSDPEDVHPIQLAIVVTPTGNIIDLGQTNGGQAFWGVHLGFAGGALARTRFNEQERNPISIGYTIAHEIGHTHGLAHDDSVLGPFDSFMKSTGGGAPTLSGDVDSFVPKDISGNFFSNAAAWELLSIRKSGPRSPGFRYVGCDDTTNPCPDGLSCKTLEHGDTQCLPST